LDFEEDEEVPVENVTYNLGQWILVRYPGKKRENYFVGKVDAFLDNGSYSVRFARKYGVNKFKWPPKEEIADVHPEDIRSGLPDPEVEGNKSRASVFKFDANFEGLNVL